MLVIVHFLQPFFWNDGIFFNVAELLGEFSFQKFSNVRAYVTYMRGHGDVLCAIRFFESKWGLPGVVYLGVGVAG